MKITYKLIKKVKDMNKKSWKDKKYHDFNSNKEVIAIGYALIFSDYNDLKSIKTCANDFLKVI